MKRKKETTPIRGTLRRTIRKPRPFWAFVGKEFRHILRDRRTLLILFGMPVVQIVLFGFAISTEVKNVRLAVFDPSRDEATSQIVREFDASRYFTLTEMLPSADRITEVFRQDKADLVLVFGERFRENLLHTGRAQVQLIADGTDPNTATTLSGYASSVLGAYQQRLTDGNGIPAQIRSELKLLYNPQMEGAYNFVPGVMGLILMIICAMMTSISIVREKERGTMEVLLVSPVRPLSIIVAKAVPYFALSAVNLASILLLSVGVLGVPMAGNLFWLSVVSLIFILVSLSLGLLISTLVRTQVAAMLASGMVLIMPVVILSGMMFPVESMPLPLQWASDIIPAKWFIIAVKKIMIEGLPVHYALREITILSAMALLLLTVSIRKFKHRLE